MEKSKDFYDPFTRAKGAQFKILPHEEEVYHKKIMYTLPVLVCKVKLLRAIYPYLKILKDNPYIRDRKFHMATFNAHNNIHNLPSVYYSYRFTFRPFKEKSDSEIIIDICLDFFTDEIVVNIIREKDKSGMDKNNLLTHIFQKDGRRPYTLDAFEDIINNAHLNTAKYLFKSNDSFGFLSCCTTYMPDEILYGDTKVANMYKSTKGVDKFKL